MRYMEAVIEFDAEAPKLEEGTIVTHKDEKGEETLLELLCPCGCGDPVKVNLQTTSRVKAYVFKKYREKGSPYLFFPAMQRISGCRTRFIVSIDGEMTFSTPKKDEV